MRISTAAQFHNGIASILDRQAEVAKVQNQISSNSRLLTAADDPAAAAQGLKLDQSLADIGVWQGNIGTANSRLSMEESALSSSTDILNQVRTLVVQANSAGQSDSSRAQIAGQLDQLYQQLMETANTDDGNGRYLFGGSADGSVPFSQGSPDVIYNGDQSPRMLAIGAQRQVADGDSGALVFQQLRSGNGSFEADTPATNTGTLQLKSSQVIDSTLWDGGSYTIKFSGGNYQVLDSANAVVVSGAYTAGSSISFRGAQVSLSGTPADGDSVTLDPSQQKDIFSTLKDLISAVRAPAGTDVQRAQQQTQFSKGLTELQAAQDHISAVRSTVGTRMDALDSAGSSLDSQTLVTKQSLSSVRDVDLASASSQLALSQTVLQAAEQSYLKVQGLSLFNFLQ